MSRKGRALAVLLLGGALAGAAGTAAGTVGGVSPAASSLALNQPNVPAAHPERGLTLAITRAGSRVIAVGEHGKIALSDDSGTSWRGARQVPVDVTLTSVRFADQKTGWAIGHLGVVLKSEDGGETWRQQLDGRAAAALALKQLERSGQGGSAAQRALAKTLVDDGPDKPWLDLLVEDVDRVVVVGAFGLAMRTEDGGRTWVAIGLDMPNERSAHLYGIGRSVSACTVVGEQGLLLTAPSCHGPYRTQSTPYDGSFFGVVALGEHGWLVYGLRGNVFLTVDDSRSWSRIDVPGATATFNAAIALNDGRVILGDQAGRLFISTPDGRRFAALSGGGAPVTGVALAPSGDLLVSTVAGIMTVRKADIDAKLARM